MEVKLECSGQMRGNVYGCRKEGTITLCDSCFEDLSATPGEVDAMQRLVYFVEKWNKKDEDKDVADAASIVVNYIERV